MPRSSLALYRTLIGAAGSWPALPRAVRRTITQRRRSGERWLNWASEGNVNRPLLWFHGASVGEAITAWAVAERFRESHPRAGLVHTHSSPSVSNFPTDACWDRSDFLPWDDCRSVEQVLGAVRPDVMVFSRDDVWPELVRAASDFSIPTAVVAGEVRPDSLRLRFPYRQYFKGVHETLHRVGAVSEPDAERWMRLGVPQDRVDVTGDPRHDLMLQRAACADPPEALRTWAARRRVIVAGSLEPADESLLPGFLEALRQVPESGLILVPHDPESAFAERLGRQLARFTPFQTWNGSATPKERVVVVKKKGTLFSLYGLAAVAYVGGGFKRGRQHSAAEPAAFGVAPILGPHAADSADARSLVEGDTAVVLPERGAPARLVSSLTALLNDPADRAERGVRSRETLTQGAVAQSTALIEGVMAGR